MMKFIAPMAFVAVALAAPLAGAQPATTSTFMTSQNLNHFSASEMIGSVVYGQNNTNIGDVNDVLVSKDGKAQLVVIGVGGFLGVGEKNVAVPVSALQITPTSNGDDIAKISSNFTKDQLEKAPIFQWRKRIARRS